MMLIVTPDQKRANLIPRACRAEESFHHVAAENPDIGELLRFLENNTVDTVIVGPGLAPAVSESITTEIANQSPFIGIVVFADEDPDSIRTAFRAGAADVVSEAMRNEAVALVVANVHERMDRRLAAGSATLHGTERKTRVVTVLSSRGGVGRTLIAATLASALQTEVADEVVLVDLDLQAGDVAPLLGLTPHLSIASVAGRADELDSADVKAILSKDESGLHVLAAPPSLTASVEVSPDLVTALLKLLSASFRYVVIDTGPYIAETTLAAVDASTDLLLLCAPDVPSVRALGRMSDALDDLHVVAPRRHLVVNKATDRYGMPMRDIEAVSGMSAISEVPAAKDVAVALNRGTPFHDTVHTRSVAQKALGGLIRELCPENASPKRRLLWRSR